ncbi:MAG: pyruvate carboxylase subunit B [Chloroflexi bacterium]|nr:pyruvate carboxylase subunit B [Chloroflexota bacterium]
MAKNRVKITDVTFRDGHQSLLATRLRAEDMLPIAAEMEKAGFHSVEVWGGATFDVATRFLNEDPWERVRLLKKLMPKTPFQMLLRGQNLVGYRHYADDVVTAFVHHAAEVGIDIFRVFDALNDERNFETALKEIKRCKKHAQLAISYSLTEPKMGGPIYNLYYYIEKAHIFEDMGADSLCIKDMAGIVSPDDAYTLIKALKKEIKIPIQFHTHYTSGMASMAYLKAIEAGVDILDTALAPFALRSAQPAIEPIVVTLQGSDRDTGLDLQHLFKLGQYFESIAPKYRDFLDSTTMAVIDTEVLVHQIPGGMISNLVSQLREAGALHRIDEVYEEIPRVRKELGYPPLVTPTSQIVGIQAVQNVLFGRYKMISAQVKDLVYGLYGKTPAPIDPKVQQIVLKGYERGETPITCRAADVLEAEMEKAREATKGIARDIGDVLTYALYPTTGLRFLKWKYGLETPPPETKPRTLEDVKREDELIAKAKTGKLAEKLAPAKGPSVRTFNVYLGQEVYSVGVESADGAVTFVTPAPASAPATVPAAAKPVEQKAPAPPVVRPVEKEATAKTASAGTPIVAPIAGIVIRYEVKVGDEVKPSDVVLVLEAMKMANDIVSPVAGKVKSINFKDGDHVRSGDVLAVIA